MLRSFAEAAALCGVSKAAYIRKAITGALLKPTIVITSVNDELLKKLDDLIAQYGKIGGNLNQIARHLNEYGIPYTDLEKEVRDVAVDLAMLKYEVFEKVATAVGDVSSSQTLRWFAPGPIYAKNTVPLSTVFLTSGMWLFHRKGDRVSTIPRSVSALAGVAYSCISRVSPVSTIGVWLPRN